MEHLDTTPLQTGGAGPGLLAHVPDTQPTSGLFDGKLATHIDWYRDATRWLVTTSGAAIVFGYGFVSGNEAGRLERVAFTVSGAILLMSVFGGIASHFWILRYARAVERLTVATDAAKRERLEAVMRDTHKWMPVYSGLMLWAFFAGMAVFVFFCGYRIWNPPPRQPSQPSVLTWTTDNNTALAVVDSDRRGVWILTRSAKSYEWRRIEFPNSAPSRTSVGDQRPK
jgi:hypothetical protein